MEVYRGLPELLRKERCVLRLRARAALLLDDQVDEALREYRAAPDEPGVDLVALYYYLQKQRYEDLLSCVDRLDQAIGGDPRLDVFRMITYLARGDMASAKKCAQNAAAADPDLLTNSEAVASLLNPEGQASVEQTAGGQSLTAAPGVPPADDEARAFAESLEKSLTSGDVTAVHNAVDVAAFNQRATAKLDMPPQARAGIVALARSGADFGLTGILDEILKGSTNGETIRLLRVHQVDGEPHALYRLVPRDTSVGYVEFVLLKHADGHVHVDDAQVFEFGGLLSKSVGEGIMIGYRSTLATATPAHAGQDGVSPVKTLRQMQQSAREGKFQEALDLYQGLPVELQHERSILRMRADAARRLGGQAFDDALDALRKAFPDDAGVDLLMIDLHLQHHRYDKALASLDAIDRMVGGGPYLDSLRARAHNGKGTLTAAKRCARNSIKGEPALPSAYLSLLSVSLQEKEFGETSRLLTIVRDKFPSQMPNVATDTAYAKYLHSPQYRKWAGAKKP
jgi:tetratricopeptide (TPR) repeat protein